MLEMSELWYQNTFLRRRSGMLSTQRLCCTAARGWQKSSLLRSLGYINLLPQLFPFFPLPGVKCLPDFLAAL